MFGAEVLFAPAATHGPWSYAEGVVLDDAQCDAVVDAAERTAGWGSARVYRDGAVHLDLSERSVRSQAFDTTQHPAVVTAIVRQLADWNEQIFRFDLSGIPGNDEFNVLRYDAGYADHFRDHADAGTGSPTRKLTFVIQLSAPEDYAGCDLVLTGSGHTVARTRGTMVAFPATARHAVTPVMAGIRHCIVGWVHGPTFR